MSAAHGADIVFLLGLSGAGKTTLASWLAEDWGWLHLEIDRPEEDGIDLEGFRPEWNAFLGTGQPADLARVIRGRTAITRRRGAVLSFSSELVLDVVVIRAAEAAGIGRSCFTAPVGNASPPSSSENGPPGEDSLETTGRGTTTVRASSTAGPNSRRTVSARSPEADAAREPTSWPKFGTG